MHDTARAPAKALISILVLLGAVVAHEAFSTSGRSARSAAGPSMLNETAKERQGRCPATHRTVLVRVFGDALCPVSVQKPGPFAP